MHGTDRTPCRIGTLVVSNLIYLLSQFMNVGGFERAHRRSQQEAHHPQLQLQSLFILIRAVLIENSQVW